MDSDTKLSSCSLCLKGCGVRTTPEPRWIYSCFLFKSILTMMCSLRLHKQQPASSRESWTVFFWHLACSTPFSCTSWTKSCTSRLSLEGSQTTSLLEWLPKLKCVTVVEEREENCQVVSGLLLWLRTSFTCVFSWLQPVDRALLLCYAYKKPKVVFWSPFCLSFLTSASSHAKGSECSVSAL